MLPKIDELGFVVRSLGDQLTRSSSWGFCRCRIFELAYSFLDPELARVELQMDEMLAVLLLGCSLVGLLIS